MYWQCVTNRGAMSLCNIYYVKYYIWHVVGHAGQVVRLDVKEHAAYLENGKSVTYDKCLVATGTLTAGVVLVTVQSCSN